MIRPLPGTIGPILSQYPQITKHITYSLLIVSKTEDYPRCRRVLSHAFSDSALRYQESIILEYCDKLISRLAEVSVNSRKVDMVFWFNAVAFDITGNLSLGKSFNSMEEGRVHPWMKNIFDFTRLIAWTMCWNHYPGVSGYVFATLNSIPSVGKVSQEHEKYAKERVAERLRMDVNRKDFIGYE